MAYEKKEKPGVMLYWKTFDALEKLVDGEAKKMLRAIRQYAQHGEFPDFSADPVLDMAWTLLRPELDADAQRYEKVIEQRRAAGLASAAKRATPVNEINTR